MSSWVDVGELLEPLATWLATRTEKPVGDTRTPIVDGKASVPPFTVLYTVSHVRTPEGAHRWGVLARSVGGVKAGPVPQQARLLGDRVSRAFCDQDFAGRFVNAIDLGVDGVVVESREANGDGHQEPGEKVDEWVESFTLTLVHA